MSSVIAAGRPLPDIVLEGTDGTASLAARREGKPLIIAFYTEDSTPLCSAELNTFRDDFEVIRELGATMVAISADDAASHAGFAQAQQYPFPLLADPRLDAARAFGVVDETGKRSIRAIFVSDANGVIVAALPYYNPANGQQYQAVFAALGMDLG
ncbi:MAG TPA: peroxiredoxin family protein [Dehalococcoidia bacterium]|nr:peroxiredoxin family protein [Dehalococcoidia bacterium]